VLLAKTVSVVGVFGSTELRCLYADGLGERSLSVTAGWGFKKVSEMVGKDWGCLED
jgi:hypothetical protein